MYLPLINKTRFYISLKLLLLLLLIYNISLFSQVTNISKKWLNYKKTVESGKKTTLPNYSFAGYAYGEQSIPTTTSLGYKVFDVRKFGAIPNDGRDDRIGIQKTIYAAQKNGSGIVFFPKGHFLVNSEKSNYSPIRINHSRIILKGSGSTPGGTVIEMLNHMYWNKNNRYKWRPPAMFLFMPGDEINSNLSPYLTNRKSPYQTVLLNDASQGTTRIKVKNAALFNKDRFIILSMESLDAVKMYLSGKKTRKLWSRINNSGVSLIEIHEISKIEGNEIILKKPIITDMKSEHQWFVSPYQVLEGCGFEDIHFKGNFKEEFVHHKNYIHDGGWGVLQMNKVAYSWVQRCRISDVNQGITFGGAIASSILMIQIDGYRGHSWAGLSIGTRNLIGLCRDRTDKGQFHGINASHLEAGSVVWRINAPRGRGYDVHSTYTRQTLFDLYEGHNMTGHGGDYRLEPHHLNGFTLWNFKLLGPAVKNYDFWRLKPKKKKSNSPYWGFAIPNPLIVGFHGSKASFVKKNVILESLGKKVWPESLYEEQLKLRLTYYPKWILNTKKEWEKLQAKYPTK